MSNVINFPRGTPRRYTAGNCELPNHLLLNKRRFGGDPNSDSSTSFTLAEAESYSDLAKVQFQLGNVSTETWVYDIYPSWNGVQGFRHASAWSIDFQGRRLSDPSLVLLGGYGVTETLKKKNVHSLTIAARALDTILMEDFQGKMVVTLVQPLTRLSRVKAGRLGARKINDSEISALPDDFLRYVERECPKGLLPSDCIYVFEISSVYGNLTAAVHELSAKEKLILSGAEVHSVPITFSGMVSLEMGTSEQIYESLSRYVSKLQFDY